MRFSEAQFLTTFVFILNTFGRCEYFTSTSHLKTLLRLEFQLTKELKNVIQKEESKLNRIKEFYNDVRDMSDVPPEKYGSVTGHPINAYLLIKRLLYKWKDVSDLIQSSKGKGKHIFFASSYMYFLSFNRI